MRVRWRGQSGNRNGRRNSDVAHLEGLNLGDIGRDDLKQPGDIKFQGGINRTSASPPTLEGSALLRYTFLRVGVFTLLDLVARSSIFPLYDMPR
jgi:hypothetical protein